MNMKISISMCIADFFRIDVRKPVICCNFLWIFENKSSDRISYICIFINSPIKMIKVLIHRISYVKKDLLFTSKLSSLSTIGNETLGYSLISFPHQDNLYGILDNLNIRNIRTNFLFHFVDNLVCKCRYSGQVFFSCRFECSFDGIFNFFSLKRDDNTISFPDFVDSHTYSCVIRIKKVIISKIWNLCHKVGTTLSQSRYTLCIKREPLQFGTICNQLEQVETIPILFTFLDNNTISCVYHAIVHTIYSIIYPLQRKNH